MKDDISNAIKITKKKSLTLWQILITALISVLSTNFITERHLDIFTRVLSFVNTWPAIIAIIVVSVAIVICVYINERNTTERCRIENDNKRLSEINIELTNKIKQLEEANSNLRNAQEDLKESINEYKVSSKILEKDMEILENANDELKNQLEKYINEISDYKVKSISLSKEIKELKDRKKALEIKLSLKENMLTIPQVYK